MKNVRNLELFGNSVNKYVYPMTMNLDDVNCCKRYADIVARSCDSLNVLVSEHTVNAIPLVELIIACKNQDTDLTLWYENKDNSFTKQIIFNTEVEEINQFLKSRLVSNGTAKEIEKVKEKLKDVTNPFL